MEHPDLGLLLPAMLYAVPQELCAGIPWNADRACDVLTRSYGVLPGRCQCHLLSWLPACSLCSHLLACICSMLNTLCHEWSFCKACHVTVLLCSTHTMPCTVPHTFHVQTGGRFPQMPCLFKSNLEFVDAFLLSPVLVCSTYRYWPFCP